MFNHSWLNKFKASEYSEGGYSYLAQINQDQARLKIHVIYAKIICEKNIIYYLPMCHSFWVTTH